MVRSCWRFKFQGKYSGPTAFTFTIAFTAATIFFSVGSILCALATGCCGSFFRMPGPSMLNLEFSSERMNCTNFSRIRPLSRSSLSFSSRTYFDSTSSSPPVTGLPCATTQRRDPRRNERLLHFVLSSTSDMPSCRPSAAAHPWCLLSGTATLRASHQWQPAAQLPFGHLYSNLALVSFVFRVESPIQRSA